MGIGPQWIYEAERKAHFFAFELIYNVWVGKVNVEIDFTPRQNYAMYGIGEDGFVYQAKEVYEYSEQQIDRIIKAKDYAEKFLNRTNERIERVKVVAQQIQSTDLKEASVNNLCKLLRPHRQAYLAITCLVGEIRNSNWRAETRLRELLIRDFKKEDVQEEILILTTPLKKSILNQYDEDFFALLTAIQKDSSKMYSLIAAFLKAYEWIPVGFNDEPPMVCEGIAQKVKDHLSKMQDAQAHIRSTEELQRTVREKHQFLFKEHTLSTETRRLVAFIAEANFQKDNIKLMQNRYCHFESRLLYEEVARRAGRSIKDIYWLTTDEMIEALQQGACTEPLADRIAKRKDAYWLAKIDGVEEYEEGDRVLEKIQGILTQTIRGAGELKGTVACQGKVQGKVIVGRKVEELKGKDLTGMILVTPMTMPEYVPFLRGVIGIVTNEGGLTCHAAIISRELHIPCVIGTRIATQVFKDGDRIEVDAQRGIVRKL